MNDKLTVEERAARLLIELHELKNHNLDVESVLNLLSVTLLEAEGLAETILKEKAA